ncbi:hypothetical protein PIB30_111451 [Stylosanthes scabra]|uniref:Uncharacterized protein n=1 Tax=Stylosanthes scabra TaxID=79078 RepID=A0ABU6U1K2_9FABA|nr:hypothetical protein [Stylosanthes scabra]
MKSTLVKSLQIEGPPLQKKILRKRKQIEEQKSSSESEPKSESESESETASDSDSEKTLSEDENVGIIERRTKKRHEAINAAPWQPPQQGEADANPDATIDALPDPSTQVNINQEDHTKDADSAFAMTVKEDDTQHNAVIVDETIATAPPKDTVPASKEEVTPIFDASIAEP